MLLHVLALHETYFRRFLQKTYTSLFCAKKEASSFFLKVEDLEHLTININFFKSRKILKILL